MTDRTKDISDNGAIEATPEGELNFSAAPIGAEMSMTALDVARSVSIATKANAKIRFTDNKK